MKGDPDLLLRLSLRQRTALAIDECREIAERKRSIGEDEAHEVALRWTTDTVDSDDEDPYAYDDFDAILTAIDEMAGW